MPWAEEFCQPAICLLARAQAQPTRTFSTPAAKYLFLYKSTMYVAAMEDGVLQEEEGGPATKLIINPDSSYIGHTNLTLDSLVQEIDSWLLWPACTASSQSLTPTGEGYPPAHMCQGENG